MNRSKTLGMGSKNPHLHKPAGLTEPITGLSQIKVFSGGLITISMSNDYCTLKYQVNTVKEC